MYGWNKIFVGLTMVEKFKRNHSCDGELLF